MEGRVDCQQRMSATAAQGAAGTTSTVLVPVNALAVA